MARYDWDYYRHKYVTTDLTLEEMAELPKGPALGTLKRYSSQQDWPAQRRHYRDQTATKTRELASVTEAEVAARHARMARTLQEKALERLATLNIEALDVRDVLAYIKESADMERKALGLDNRLDVNVSGIDLDALTDEQLAAIAAGANPRDVLAAG